MPEVNRETSEKIRRAIYPLTILESALRERPKDRLLWYIHHFKGFVESLEYVKTKYGVDYKEIGRPDYVRFVEWVKADVIPMMDKYWKLQNKDGPNDTGPEAYTYGKAVRDATYAKVRKMHEEVHDYFSLVFKGETEEAKRLEKEAFERSQVEQEERYRKWREANPDKAREQDERREQNRKREEEIRLRHGR